MESKTPEGLTPEGLAPEGPTPEGPAQRRTTPVWDPEQYVRFGDHRDRPFFDLTARIGAQQPRLVVDLGCGPGTLTASLALRWPGARVVGVDSSVQMIQAAQRICHAPDAPKNLSFALGDIAGWMPEPDTDVLVSNAALQWVPGHQTLLAAWLRALNPGSWLAVQVPGNFRSPSHALMRDVATSERWQHALAGVLRDEDTVGEPDDYLRLLLDSGCAADVWESTFQQVLTGERPVLDWVRGTALRPILAALGEADAAEFEETYAALLAGAYPTTAQGTIFPFRRIFAVAQKRAAEWEPADRRVAKTSVQQTLAQTRGQR
ncbi:trans-aconitate 2-methyltransferase [Arthrobacter sp. H14-L1]|uniref:trans-aconitate 2-methyltransferase n=1 Tax=Arthrobacter sp. H14-L1 TaxID=2996697 RepID=UPI002271F3FC|nr:trans-aconitate 2-methyltransferase [Arthrobacter sp. H14-L1]MCY0905243.1 trans-aconitate 2-methyltransferase [Arthrobacter sp. H14-L1]